MSIWLQKSASIQPRSSPYKLAKICEICWKNRSKIRSNLAPKAWTGQCRRRTASRAANSIARTWEMAKEISKSRIPNSPVNLSGLVLFCIDTSDSESRRIFQHFSRSTRLSHLCTAPVLIFALFCSFSSNCPDFWKILRIFQQIEHFSPQISRNFAGIAGNWRGKFFL